MDKPNRLTYVALVVALLALVAPLGEVAQAAGRKIGKNLVVTKSIKNGAVTGQKVKDGSLTGADLAAGTVTTANLAPGAVPVPTKDKSVGFAGCGTCVGNAPNQVTALQLSGYIPGGSGVTLRVPVTVQIADVNVFAALQTAGHTLSVQLAYKPPGEPTFTTVPLCTVTVGDAGCDATGPVTVPAGNETLLEAVAGPGGASGASIVIGYTMRVP